MPNGWYPVPGLDVILINRSEQRYPRHEWHQSWDSLWVAQYRGARGCAPVGEMHYSPESATEPAAALVEAAHTLVAAESMQGTASAAVARVDFRKKTGFACGTFSVYGFKDGQAEILLDLTLGGAVPKEYHASVDPMYLDIQTSYISDAGLCPKEKPLESFQFQFEGMDSLVISSEALHYDAHWPPKNSLDCVAIALAKPRQLDIWMAIWKAEPPTSG